MYAEANRKQKVSKQRKLNYLPDGYLGFSKFCILTPKISKNKFFWEKCSKIQNFHFFQKTYYMYRKHMKVVSMPNFKFLSQFLTPK